MLSWFEAELPIRDRLWIVVLVSVLSGHFAPIATALASNPTESLFNLLLLFGFIEVLQLPGAFLFSSVDTTMVLIRRYRKAWKDSFAAAVSDGERGTTLVWDCLDALNYIGATLVAFAYADAPLKRTLGLAGVAIFLFQFLVKRFRAYDRPVEVLELRQIDKQSISATLIAVDGIKEQFDVQSGFLEVMGRLLDARWDSVHVSTQKGKSYALMRRSLEAPRSLQVRRAKSRRALVEAADEARAAGERSDPTEDKWSRLEWVVHILLLGGYPMALVGYALLLAFYLFPLRDHPEAPLLAVLTAWQSIGGRVVLAMTLVGAVATVVGGTISRRMRARGRW